RHRGPADAHPGDVVEDVMPAEVERGQNGHAEEDPGDRAEESTLLRAHHEQGGGEGHGDVERGERSYALDGLAAGRFAEELEPGGDEHILQLADPGVGQAAVELGTG